MTTFAQRIYHRVAIALIALPATLTLAAAFLGYFN